MAERKEVMDLVPQEKGMTRIYRCVHLGEATRRFTVGKEYLARVRQGKLDVVTGDNGGQHYLSPNEPRFIISNAPVLGGYRWRSVPKYAHFEVIDHDQEVSDG